MKITPQAIVFQSKDFIETAEGLRFAVVQNSLENNKVLCFLRYAHIENHWQKLNSAQANHWLEQHYPQYLHYSMVLDANLHAVAVEKISQHYQPQQRLQELLDLPGFKSLEGLDAVSSDFVQLCQLFQQKGVDLNHLGVTGSLLIATQHADSDIDLVFYQRDSFQQARAAIPQLINENKLTALTAQDWEEAFSRRACELTLCDYVWHEQRKFNKAMINKRKFDLSLVESPPKEVESYQKSQAVVLKVQISDDSYGFDYPARFLLNHPQITEILCFTATYNGQARSGEWVEVAGYLEVSSTGKQRIVVGSSREARGEYLKVLR